MAYASWQVRDYLAGPGAGTAAIVFFVTVLPMLAIVGGMSPEAPHAESGLIVIQMFDTMVQFIAIVGSFISVSGFVSGDRSPGLARFLFARPVNVRAFYLQAWVVRGLSLVALALILSLIVHFFAAPVPWGRAAAVVAVSWILIGGLGFLASVLVQRDAVALVAVYLAPVTLDALRGGLPDTRWIGPALAVLPPVHLLGGIRTALLTGLPVDRGDLLHVLAFGVACVVLATFLVRRLPLVRS